MEETVTDEADRKAVSAAVANPRWSARALCDVLSRYGVDISFTAVAAHRRGACPCYNKAAPNG